MKLFLDTASFDLLRFAVIDDQGKVRSKKFTAKHNDSQRVMQALNQFLNKKLPQIDAIYAVSGPGSFSGIRSGIALALAFGFARNIPVYAMKKEKVPTDLSKLAPRTAKKISADFELNYGAEPNITKPRKK